MQFFFLFSSFCVLFLTANQPICEDGKSCPSSVSDGRIFLSTMNPKVIHAEYAVRGNVLLRALELEKQNKKIIYCNIGNPQSLGQTPITFTRRVLSLILSPELLLSNNFPSDVSKRAKTYLSYGLPGAYSDSRGLLGIRKEIANFLTSRDGYMANPEDIFLVSGASGGVEFIGKLLFRNNFDAMIVPIPQYPLYSALATLLDAHFEGYELNESSGWGLDTSSVLNAINSILKQGKLPRALVVINPGNPVGSVLSYEEIKQILLLAKQYNLVVLADEVYQVNVYDNTKKFVSFRKVLFDLNLTDVQLVSFHSISKGVMGECGLRGGFMDFVNFPQDVMSQLYKLASISLCPNLVGQFAVGLMINPPLKHDPSYELDFKERQDVFMSLKRRAELVSKKLNELQDVSVQPVQGAMYAFANVLLPSLFVTHCQNNLHVQPDTQYALDLLEETGIVVVPGNGFGQKNGTYHFRTTILPPENVMNEVMNQFKIFHEEFLKKWKK